MTNREWLMSLSDKQLAEFCTCGICAHMSLSDGNNKFELDYIISIKSVAARYTQSTLGIESWLRSPQEFMVIINNEPTGHKEYEL